MMTDITDRKRTEAELQMHRQQLEVLVRERTAELEQAHQLVRVSERMAALGTLAAGLGHDLGNLLLPLRARIECMQAKGIPAPLSEDVAGINDCIEYLHHLTKGLRLLSVDPDDTSRWGEMTALGPWWLDVASFYKNALPRGVALEQRLPADLKPVRVPQHLLTQAVFNLVHNAGAALAGRRGRVCVWAQNLAGGNQVRIGVSDDGPGMTPEVKRKCMEPFCTTKTAESSTGLGLALVHLIAQKAGGSVQVDSEPGRGTTFMLDLPAQTGAKAQPSAAPVSPAAVN